MNIQQAAVMLVSMFGDFKNLVDDKGQQKHKKDSRHTKPQSHSHTAKARAKIRRKMARLSRRKNRAA